MPFLLESAEFLVLLCWLNSCEGHVDKQCECNPKNTEALGRHTRYCMLTKITTAASTETSKDMTYLSLVKHSVFYHLWDGETLRYKNCEDSNKVAMSVVCCIWYWSGIRS